LLALEHLITSTAAERISRNFPVTESMSEVRDFLEETLLDFFDTHLARWPSFSEQERPGVELLIAVGLSRKSKNYFITQERFCIKWTQRLLALECSRPMISYGKTRGMPEDVKRSLKRQYMYSGKLRKA
jgi:hypothetical protein